MSENTSGPIPDPNTPGAPPPPGGAVPPETTPTFSAGPGAPATPPAPQAPATGPAGAPQQQWQPTPPAAGSFGQQAAAFGQQAATAASNINVPPALQFQPVPAMLGWAITGGAAVYLIGLLLPWVSFWGVSVNGLSGGGLFTYLSLLLMIGVLAIGVMIGLGKHMDWFVAAVSIGGGLAGLGTLISFLSIIGTGLASIGPWVSLLGSGTVVGVVVYIWLKLRPGVATPNTPQYGQQPGQWGTPPPPPPPPGQ